EFAPAEKLDLDLVARMIVAAREEVDSVDGVLLPESAVDESDIDDLEALLDRLGVIMLITGVRQQSRQPGQPPANWVHIGTSPRIEKGRSLPASTGEQWFHIRQNKHHPWSLERGTDPPVPPGGRPPPPHPLVGIDGGTPSHRQL